MNIEALGWWYGIHPLQMVPVAVFFVALYCAYKLGSFDHHVRQLDQKLRELIESADHSGHKPPS